MSLALAYKNGFNAARRILELRAENLRNLDDETIVQAAVREIILKAYNAVLQDMEQVIPNER